jgi:hypothetical protein
MSFEVKKEGLVTNPYSSRMPVTDPAQFYGRTIDILRVADSIRSWQIFAASGEPRIGKTSLLYYLIHSNGARKNPDVLAYIGDPTEYLFVLIELQRLPVRNATGFWRYLLDRLVEEVDKEAGSSSAQQREVYEPGDDFYQLQIGFENYLKNLKRKLIFFFDDFDIVIRDLDNAEVTQVTSTLRTLKEALDFQGKLNYIIMSTDPLVRLLKAKGITHPSPLISIINPTPPLGLLEPESATQLLQEPLWDRTQQSSEAFGREDRGFVYKLAGRYPDFLKVTSSYLFKARFQEPAGYGAIRQQIEDDPHVHWLMNGLWERVKRDEQLEALPLSETLLQVAQGQKPVSTLAMRELLWRGLIEGTPSDLRVFGDLFRVFILNQQALQVASFRSTRPFEFTPLETRLYTYLLEHLGQTCSREQLHQVLWGAKPPKSPDALEQLVKRVRGKIERRPEQPEYLLNVRGQGYLLRSDPAESLPA